MSPRRHAEIGGGLLGDLLTSVQLDVYQGHAYSDYPRISPHQVIIFCSSLKSVWFKSEIFMELPIGFGVEGDHPI